MSDVVDILWRAPAIVVVIVVAMVAGGCIGWLAHGAVVKVNVYARARGISNTEALDELDRQAQ